MLARAVVTLTLLLPASGALARARTDRPRVVVGELSPASAADAVTIARRYIRSRSAAELVAARPQTVGSLQVVRFDQRVGGLPVIGGGAAVLIDGSGRVRAASTGLAEVAATAAPSLDVAQALERASRAVPYQGRLDARHARLAVLRQGAAGRLVWAVRPEPSLLLRSAPLVLVDAVDGSIARVIELARDARLRVYTTNPVASPSPVEVDVTDLEMAMPQHLRSRRVDARNCPDRHELTQVNLMGFMVGVHLCTEAAVAEADANGDFLYTPADGTAPDDLFAESHMYWHVSRIYDFYQQLGFGDVNSLPLRSVVNFRVPLDIRTGAFDLANITNPNGVLYPFDNAFFLPGADELIPGLERNFDSIVFGQGSTIDFSWDGDVIYHEFGHAVIGATSHLDGVDLDSQGLDPSTGALNEGYADYFAAALAGDPHMGEYAGNGVGAGGAIRDLANSDSCPGSLWGEVHQDSQPWSAALWQIRGVLGAAVDRPILAALMMLQRDADFDEAAMLTAQTVTAALGAAAGMQARQVFEARGLWACERMIPYDMPRPILFGAGRETGLQPYAPGPLQLRYELAEAGGGLAVRAQVQSALPVGLPGAMAAPQPRLLVKHGAPIEFAYQGMQVSSNADADVPFTAEGAAEWRAQAAAGSYWLMIVNAGDSAIYRGITVEALAVPPPPDAGAPADASAPLDAPPALTPDAGAGGGGAAPDASGTGSADAAPGSGAAPVASDGGCSIYSAPVPPSLAPLALLLLAGVLRRRK